MPKFYNADVLDFGLDRIRTKATANNVDLLLIKAYAQGDAYATVNGNVIAQADLVLADLVLSNQGTLGRQLTVATKSPSATASSAQYDTGTATSGGASTLTDTTKAWTANQHAGRALKIVSGTGAGQVRRIASNTATVLTVDAAWTTNPDATSVYQILDDLHVAIVDVTETKVLAVTDESTNQVITAGNVVNIPAFNLKNNQPV